MGLADHAYQLMIGRLLVGIGSGVSSFLADVLVLFSSSSSFCLFFFFFLVVVAADLLDDEHAFCSSFLHVLLLHLSSFVVLSFYSLLFSSPFLLFLFSFSCLYLTHQ